MYGRGEEASKGRWIEGTWTSRQGQHRQCALPGQPEAHGQHVDRDALLERHEARVVATGAPTGAGREAERLLQEQLSTGAFAWEVNSWIYRSEVSERIRVAL